MINKDNFELIEYNGIPYPSGLVSEIKEIAAHLDKDKIETAEKYSLHTEYSYGKRKLDSHILIGLDELITSEKSGVPQLWKSNKWAEEFAEFVFKLVDGKAPPTVIEIHPPFNDYCDIDLFLDCYQIFEERIHAVYPDTNIVIENRSGSIYKGGRFIIGKAKEIAELCHEINDKDINLGVVLDFPQLLTAERMDTLKFNVEKYFSIIQSLIEYRSIIKGIHIWGKKKNSRGRWVAHAGNLDTYFGNNQEFKTAFIKGIELICDDNHRRFLVPEVNTGAEDLSSIVRDIIEI